MSVDKSPVLPNLFAYSVCIIPQNQDDKRACLYQVKIQRPVDQMLLFTHLIDVNLVLATI